MDPNNTNPANTPPANDTPPVPDTTPTSTPQEAQPAPEAQTPVFGEPAQEVAPAPSANASAPEPMSTEASATETPAPAATFSTGAPQPEGPHADKKKLGIIAAIVAGAVLLGVIGFVIFSLFTNVTQEDYRAAARQFNEVSAASSSLTSDARTLGYSSSNASDEEFQEDVAEAEASIATLKTENDELAKLKAVQVGEGGQLYGTFNDKLKAYTAYATELVASVKNLRPALATCDSVNDVDEAAARVEALKTCSSSLAEVTDVPNAQMKTYVDALAKGYGEYAAVYEQIAALSDPFGDQYEQYKTLRDQMYAIQDTIGEASDTFSDALQTRDEELSVKDSADALAEYLTEQQR